LASEKSTASTISANQASEDMHNLLSRIKSGREHFVLEENGQAVAALISMTEYQALLDEHEQSAERQQRLNQFRETARAIGEAVQNSGLSEADVMADLEEAKQEIYREYYGDD
jgi:PHD/YefM family antitoxin component YafN of YafNO toxin-antitoxin module